MSAANWSIREAQGMGGTGMGAGIGTGTGMPNGFQEESSKVRASGTRAGRPPSGRQPGSPFGGCGMRHTTGARGGSVTDVERLADQVEALRTERAADRAELDVLRAALEKRRAWQSTSTNDRRPRRRRRTSRAEAGDNEPSSVVSRRRLFGLLGGAAAAGAGLAVAGSTLTADPAGATGVTAGAADGDALQIGGFNSCSSATSLNSSTAGTALNVEAGGTSGTGILGQCNSGVNAFGVQGFSSTGLGVVAEISAGARAQLFLGGGSSTGAPSTGTHAMGEFFLDNTGVLFQCVVTGTPGTWVRQAPLVTLPAPHRVYDSRIGQPNQSPNVQGSLTFTNPPPSAASRTISCSKDASSGTVVIPSGATKLLLNLTVITISGVGALAVFPTGATQPNASSINWSAGGQVLANGLTSACNTSQRVDVAIVASTGASTDFILDAIGYYP